MALRELIGLVPAAGQASRLGPLPGSKELLPIGFRAGSAGPEPRVPFQELRTALRAGGVERAFVVLRPGKWDVPAHLVNGRAWHHYFAGQLKDDRIRGEVTVSDGNNKRSYPWMATRTR